MTTTITPTTITPTTITPTTTTTVTTTTTTARVGRTAQIQQTQQWLEICRLADLEPEWGETALIDGAQVAVFRLWDDQVVVTSNSDPRTGSPVMARGIVGTRGGVPTIASPLYKEAYSLQTGECFSNPELRLAIHPSRIIDGRVQVAGSVGTSS